MMRDPWAESCAACRGLHMFSTAAMDGTAAGCGPCQAEHVTAEAISDTAARSLAPANVSCSALSYCELPEPKQARSACAASGAKELCSCSRVWRAPAAAGCSSGCTNPASNLCPGFCRAADNAETSRAAAGIQNGAGFILSQGGAADCCGGGQHDADAAASGSVDCTNLTAASRPADNSAVDPCLTVSPGLPAPQHKRGACTMEAGEPGVCLLPAAAVAMPHCCTEEATAAGVSGR